MESPGLQPRRARPADERAPLIFHADSTVNDSIQRLLSPDFVEKRDVRPAWAGSGWLDFGASAVLAAQAGARLAGAGSSLASLRRFWAVAARRNSSWAPQGPRSRNRSSLRMRLRWANSISTFFRSRRETR